MAKSSPKRVIKNISALGERPMNSHLRTASIVLYVTTLVFGFIFVICAGYEDLASNSNQKQMQTDAFTNLCIILGSCILLLIFEFYSSLNYTMKLIRLGVMVTLLVFVGLSVSPVQKLSKSYAETPHGGGVQEPNQASIFIFAALTLAAAGLGTLINLMEIMRKNTF